MITERLMGIGSWSVKLRDDTPISVLTDLRIGAKAFSHVLITPVRVDATAISAASLLNLARFSGVYRKQEGQTVLSGPGPAMWLADEDDKGALIETTGVTLTAASFATSIAAVLPAQLTAGTVTAIAGSYTQSWVPNTDSLHPSPRVLLDRVCAYFGGEWRVNPNFTLDAGPTSALFTTTATAVALRSGGGRDVGIDGLRAIDLTANRDYEDYTTRVLLYGNTSAAGVSSGATTFKDPQGNNLALSRYINAPDVDSGNETAAATAQLNRFTGVHGEIVLSTDEYDIGGKVGVGDTIGVYDVEHRLFSTSNPVHYRGQLIYPSPQRVVGYTWPVERGMGVYFRDMTSGSAVITDLSDWVEWERPGVRVEINATPRGVTGDGGTRAA